MSPNARLRARQNWYRDLWLLELQVVVFITVGFVVWALFAWSHETADRRDQNCVLFERMQQADVRRLTTTYEYLANLDKRQLVEPINRAILRNLSTTEDTVRAEKPPAYCKGKVGLDDSKMLPIPARPRNIP